MSIRWRLAIYTVTFGLVILAITWVFQVFLLDMFFRSVKQGEMRESARELVRDLETESLPLTAYSAAMDHSLCVIVYRIDGDNISQIVNVDATGSNVIVAFDRQRLTKFYTRAHENGGAFFSHFAFGGHELKSEVDLDYFFDKFQFNDKNGNPIRVPPKNVRMVYVQIEERGDDHRYLILLDASVQPLDSTVRTLTLQFGWIAAIILLLSSIMVYFMYRHISKPLIRPWV